MNRFRTYHPFVIFFYFAVVITFSLWCKHPVCVIISYVFSLLHSVILKAKYTKYCIIFTILWALAYPLISHKGTSVLMYLPDGNPLTAESMVYGWASALSVASAVQWFLCSAKVLTTDKLMCVFGKLHPNISLFFSIILRIIPQFTNRMRKTLRAGEGIGKTTKRGNIFKRCSVWLSTFYATLLLMAENVIESVHTSKARGYGVTKRSSYSLYVFKNTDAVMMVVISLLALYIIFTIPTIAKHYHYFPSLYFSPGNISYFCVHLVLCSLPLFVEQG